MRLNEVTKFIRSCVLLLRSQVLEFFGHQIQEIRKHAGRSQDQSSQKKE